MSSKLRVASNIGLIAGQMVLLFVSREVGLSIIILSSFLSIPFFVQTKMWDVIILVSFMTVINTMGLFVR